MNVKTIQDETFQDYKKPSMLISSIGCNWKCLTELELDVSICQNCELANMKDINISDVQIVERYMKNNITSAIVIGGLEPMLQIDEVISLILEFRKQTDDDIVIYTGYYPEELQDYILKLAKLKNIIIKFGRYIPNKPKRFDYVLGIELVSDNQFALKIST